LDPHYPHDKQFLKPYRENLLWNTFSHCFDYGEYWQ